MLKHEDIKRIEFLLLTKAQELGEEGATSDEIIAALVKENPEAVHRAKDELLRRALIQLLSRVSAKTPPSVDPTQLTLWGSFDAPPQITVRGEDGKIIHKNLDVCTVGEVRSYSSCLPTARTRSPRKNGVEKILTSLAPFIYTEKDIIGDCWRASLDAAAKKKA